METLISTIDNITSPIEEGYKAIGANSPFLRFGLTAGVVGGVLYWLKPDMFFKNGRMRDWGMISTDDSATQIPLWLVACGAGIVAAIIV